ncbi:MAG: DUF5343 domain-containing protein [Sphingomonadaceae bacterium]|nr:DUF5343 domain-containing protein [Sphingomonadaceae bacterium]
MADEVSSEPSSKGTTAKKVRKEVPGNFSYTTTPGRLKETLQAIITAERPPTFNRDFIETVLGVKGGVVTGFPPILKRIGFLNNDNSPTELYGQFQAESSRSYAALTGLKNGFGELFKRNAHVDKAEDEKVKDYLVQITGRRRDDQVVSAILGTFNAIRSFAKGDVIIPQIEPQSESEDPGPQGPSSNNKSSTNSLGLSYHINIVLPETKDIAVFNAIFQSIKANLLS